MMPSVPTLADLYPRCANNWRVKSAELLPLVPVTGNLLRLLRIERCKGERAAHVVHLNIGNVVRQIRWTRSLADDGDCACGSRLRHEAHAVHLRARHGEEQGARLDAALSEAIFDTATGACSCPCADQIAEMHGGALSVAAPGAEARHQRERLRRRLEARRHAEQRCQRSMMLPVTGPGLEPAVEKP